MAKDWGRRACLAILGLSFLFLVYLCAEGRTILRMQAEIDNPRQNQSLSIEMKDGHALFVYGEGRVNGIDLNAMIRGEGLDKNDIRDIVIGDGITEIGYEAICEYESLETVWLGKNVTVAGNGSLCRCPSLRFIYLPGGFSRAGKDFLYDCGQCYVVSEGKKKKLPGMRNVKKQQLLTEIADMDALRSALGDDAELPDGLRYWWL